tara:strand:- start:42 stop:734 length:693 start_codon:yes stop_codon:yes gene_type:complete
MATTEIGIHHIQKQVDNCDTIVENIDKIVPKLYKIRQQALAQKEYINDVSKVLLDNLSALTTAAGNTVDGKSLTMSGNIDVSTHVNTAVVSSAAAVTATNADSRTIIQSLFKYKHEVGKTTHFTTEQIGGVTDRTHGLNLSDVVTITSGLNTYLSTPNAPTAISSNITDILLEPIDITKESVVVGTAPITDTAAAAGNNGNYAKDATEGLSSLLQTRSSLIRKVVGFGLT